MSAPNHRHIGRYFTHIRLAELHAGLVSLKAQSNESFAFAAQARSALPDISDLRSTIEDSSQSLDISLSLIGSSGLPLTLIQNFSTSRKTSPSWQK